VEVNLDNHKVIRLFQNGKALVNERVINLYEDQLAEAYDQAGTRLFELTITKDNAQQLVLPAHGFTILRANNTVFIQVILGLCRF
jgi:hypothetical protein